MDIKKALKELIEDIEEIKKFNSVLSVSPFIYSQVMLKSSSESSGAILKGIAPNSALKGADSNSSKGVSNSDLKKSYLFEDSIENKIKEITDAESWETKIDSLRIPKVILGKKLAENLEVRKGDTIYIILTKGRVSPIGHIPVMKRVIVSGVFDSGLYEYDSSLLYMSIADAQNILNMENTITGIGIMIKNIYEAPEISKQIVSKLGPLYWAKDWMNMNKNLFSALKMEKTAMFIILILIVLVAAFNIASTLIMMVMEKKKDIAILKAMGASDKSVKKIFVLKGLIIGGLGTFIGVFSGVCICLLLARYKFINLPDDIYFFATLPVELRVIDVLMIAVSSLTICFLATLYPAHQASKLNPVNAIRYG